MTSQADAGREHCTRCNSREVYQRRTSANGGHGPHLLPGLGRLFRPAKIDIYLCPACGHMELAAVGDARQNVPKTSYWRRVR